MRQVAGFPSTIWDGLTKNVPDVNTNAAPGYEDFDEITAEVVALQTHLGTLAATDSIIWVSKNGVAARATGSFGNPFASLAAAFAAVTTTKKIVVILPGAYNLAGSTAIPVRGSNVRVIGLGQVLIYGASGGNQAFSLTPGVQDEAIELDLQNLTIVQYSAKKGIYIDDTAMSQTLTLNLTDVNIIMSSSGSSIDLLHAVAGKAVTINSNRCKFTGPVTVDCINASDRFNFDYCNLAGGLVSDTGAVAAGFKFQWCEILHEGITGGNAAQTVKALYCTSSTGVLTDASDIAGSQTASLVSPVSA